jgi:hypothetical protein
MSQEELLVLIYKKDEGHLHIYMICIPKVYFRLLIPCKKQRRSRRCACEVFVKIWKNIDSTMKAKILHLDSEYCQNTLLDKLRSKNFLIIVKNLSTDYCKSL